MSYATLGMSCQSHWGYRGTSSHRLGKDSGLCTTTHNRWTRPTALHPPQLAAARHHSPCPTCIAPPTRTPLVQADWNTCRQPSRRAAVNVRAHSHQDGEGKPVTLEDVLEAIRSLTETVVATKEEMSATKEGMSAMKQEMAEGFGRVHDELGLLLEFKYRPIIARMEGQLGKLQSDPVLLEGLRDLAGWLALQFYGEYEKLTDTSALLHQMCTALVELDAAGHMLRRIYDDIQNMDPAARESGPDSTEMQQLYEGAQLHKFAPDEGADVDTSALEMFSRSLQGHDKHQPLLRTLNDIRILSSKRNNEQQVEYLKKAGGLALCLAVFAAQREEPADSLEVSRAKTYDGITRGLHQVAINIQGSVTVGEDTVVIRVKEFRSRGSLLEEGVDRLKLRLALLKWAVRTTSKHVGKMTAIGKLYIPGIRDEYVDDVSYAGGRIEVVKL